METIRQLLGMAHDWMAQLLHWVEVLAESPNAAWGLFTVSFAESSFFPIPPDVLLIPLCLGRPELAFWFAGICSLGSVIGGVAGYGIGFWGGRPLLRKMFSEQKIVAVHGYYDRYNAWATGIAGLTPLPYKLFTLSGGAFEINLKVFLIASVISRSLRFFAVGALVYVSGEAAKGFIDKHLGWLSVAFVILLIGGFWIVGRKARSAARSAPEQVSAGAIGRQKGRS